MSGVTDINPRVMRSAVPMVVFAMVLGVPLGAVAQQGEVSRVTAELETIIVTSTRRDESIMDVPISMQALSSTALKRLSAQNFVDYARTLAGVSFLDLGPGRNQVFMRGISTGRDVNTGKEATVAIYYDEIPVTEGSSQPDLKLFDVERIEILRGPQGTLYGSGALGGTMRVITKRPVFDVVEGYVEAQGSIMRRGEPSGSVNGALNLPISEKIAVRALGYGSWNGGFLDNGFTGEKDVNSDYTYGGRVALSMQANERLNITLTAYHQQTHSKVWLQQTDDYPNLIINQSAAEPHDDKFTILNAELTYNFDFATLTSSTTYMTRNRDFSNDLDWFTESLLGFPRADSDLSYQSKSYIQEVRLVSAGDGALNWLIGGFFSKRPEDYMQTINPVDATPIEQGDNFLYNQTVSEVRQYAAFGEVGYQVLPKLTLTAGARISKVKREAVSIQDGVIFGGLIEQSGRQKETPITPKFNISYKAAENALLYAQANKGFRVGGVNPGLPPCSTCVVQLTGSFDSDSLWNYELGLKLGLFNSALSTNISVFYIDWTNIQLNVSREDGFNGFLNAGDARSKGVEWTVNGNINRNLQAGGQVTYIDAKLKSLAPGVTGIGMAGDKLPATASWTASGYVEVGMDVLSDGWIYLRGDVQYVGARDNTFESRPSNVRLDSYTLIDLKAGLEKGPYEISIFVKNLTDKRAQLGYEGFSGVRNGNPIVYDRYAVNRPRTIGLTFLHNF